MGKKILVDMDQTVADFEGGFLVDWRRLYPEEIYYTVEQRNCFYVREQYGPELHDKVVSVIGAAGFFSNLPIIPDSVEAISSMKAAGHTILICTAPLSWSYTCMQEKYDWVLKYFGKEMADTMVISKDKTLIWGDILIDDRPSLKGAYQPEWEHVLFDAPYNRDVQDKRRLANWQEAYRFFNLS